MNRENNLKTFIVRCGEVALKGKNKPYFERVLVERIRRALGEPRDISVKRQEGLIFIKAPESCDEEDIIKKVRKVFGVASISPAVEAESEEILDLVQNELRAKGFLAQLTDYEPVEFK